MGFGDQMNPFGTFGGDKRRVVVTAMPAPMTHVKVWRDAGPDGLTGPILVRREDITDVTAVDRSRYTRTATYHHAPGIPPEERVETVLPDVPLVDVRISVKGSNGYMVGSNLYGEGTLDDWERMLCGVEK